MLFRSPSPPQPLNPAPPQPLGPCARPQHARTRLGRARSSAVRHVFASNTHTHTHTVPSHTHTRVASVCVCVLLSEEGQRSVSPRSCRRHSSVQLELSLLISPFYLVSLTHTYSRTTTHTEPASLCVCVCQGCNAGCEPPCFPLYSDTYIYILHLADALIQSDLQ